MDVTKNIFSRAYDGLFGPSSPITNEPTIDYNHTIHSMNSPFKSPSLTSSSPRFGAYEQPTFAIEDEDSDEELNNDMNSIYNQFTDTNSRLSNNYLNPLPHDYPGSFTAVGEKSLAAPPRRRPFSSPSYDSTNAGAHFNDRFHDRDSGYTLFAENESRPPTSRFSSRPSYRSQPSSSAGIGPKLDKYNLILSKYDDYDIPARYEPSFTSKYDRAIPSKYEKPLPSQYKNPILSKYEPGVSKYDNSTNVRRPISSDIPRYNDTLSRFGLSRTPRENRSYEKPVDSKLAALNGKINRYTNRDKSRFDIYNDSTPRDDTIDKQIKELEKEINSESLTKINTKFNKDKVDINLQQLKQLNSLNDRVARNNDFLKELNTLVDINQDRGIKIKEFEKYDELRQDYVKELHNYQDFYLNYLKLFKKYKSIKHSAPKNMDNTKLITKLNLIKESTNEQSVKLICNNLLNELQ